MQKKTRFAGYEVQFDTIIDHDAYQFLRITLEVPRDQDEMAYVVLNGREVGTVRTRKEGRKVAFVAFRLPYGKDGVEVPIDNFVPSKEIGKAAAAVISEFVR